MVLFEKLGQGLVVCLDLCSTVGCTHPNGMLKQLVVTVVLLLLPWTEWASEPVIAQPRHKPTSLQVEVQLLSIVINVCFTQL
uniref:Uncharacterized protein n=1 Tax=Arundo donax TaxID=35708 RepID=A0A0A9FHL1_ARUDO